MNKVVQLCAAPGTGKNAVCEALYYELRQRDGEERWLLTDNEFGVGGYSPIERYLDSEREGIPLDTSEFARKFNLPRQLKYQEMTRQLSAATGRNIIMPGPFENLFCEVDDPKNTGRKIPLLEKLRHQDFAEFQLITIQLVLVPLFHQSDSVTLADLEDPEWIKTVGHEFERRLRKRIDLRARQDPFLGRVQRILDETKLEDAKAFALARLKALVTTHERFETPLVVYRQGDLPADAAERMLKFI